MSTARYGEAMSDAADVPERDADLDSAAGFGSDPSTGNALVDQVVAEVTALRELPLDQHVPVFERAHEQLRHALDSPRS